MERAYQGLGRGKQEQYPPRTLNPGDSLAKLKVVLPTGIWGVLKSWSYTLSSSSSPSRYLQGKSHGVHLSPPLSLCCSVYPWVIPFSLEGSLCCSLWTNGICINIWEERVEAVGSKILFLYEGWPVSFTLHPCFYPEEIQSIKCQNIPLWHRIILNWRQLIKSSLSSLYLHESRI